MEQGVLAESGVTGRMADRFDSAAFEAFYVSTAPSLAAYIRRVCGDASAAEDILQEAFCRFLRLRHEGMNEARMRGYLYRAATTIIYDLWRRRKVAERKMPIVPDHVIADPSVSIDVTRALDELAPRERALVWLAYVEGASHAEIGIALGLSVLSVRVLLFRARAKLARLLRKEEGK